MSEAPDTQFVESDHEFFELTGPLPTAWDEHRRLRWSYRYYDDSFPRYALDEHVVIGGTYFDVKETSYSLVPRDASTELTGRMTYRVSTRFNWYAVPVARFLMENLLESNLAYYRRRSES